MTGPAHRPPKASDAASARNRREVAVVNWLIDRLAIRLADRGGGLHRPPWEPRQQVLLGVLEPTRVQPPPAVDNDEETDEPLVAASSPAETVTKPTGEVPTIGLDFRIAADDVGDLQLSISVGFAMYLEQIADLSDQLTYLGVTAESAVSAATESIAAATDACPGDLTSEDHMDGDDASDPDDNTPPSAATHGMAHRGKKTRVLGAWRRHDVLVHGLELTVPLDGTVVTVEEPLQQAAGDIIAAHYAQDDAMRPFTTKRNAISRDALRDEATFRGAVHEVVNRDWRPTVPNLDVQAFAQSLGNGEYLVSVTMRNATQITERPVQDLSVYDCQISVHPGASTPIVPQRFDLAPRDYRLEGEAEVIGRGIACVAVPTADGGIRTETLPTHVQHVVVPRDDHVESPVWTALAADPNPILYSIHAAMEDYEDEFKRFVATAAGQPHQAEASREHDQFSDELRRFRLGLGAMKNDARLTEAFQLANEVFARANAGKPFHTWRLFQLVYIVSHLPALAAREHADAEYRDELDFVDVLWFPAGGGKTEAYLGLIITALFYDRLRGKNLGVTSWLRFPLRMLSVQQLARMLRVLVLAEDLRIERKVGPADADGFALGYLVGSTGTPNTLKWKAGWWRGWEAEARLAARGEFSQAHLNDRLVSTCPACGLDKVVLDLDQATVRLVHRCTGCSRNLPLYMTDEEVYRYLPPVVISTVDKLTGYTWFPEYTAFSHGPRFRCPKHGYYSYPVQGACLVGTDHCAPPKHSHPPAPATKDPVPALTVQDEMHLLKEELGAFGGHYEGLIAELQRGGPSGLPTKVLAASATIEQYEDQLRQVYGRRPRAFPAPGYERNKSFYTEAIPDVRRTFVGVLPHYRRKADVAAIVQAELLAAVAYLQDELDPLAALGIHPSLWDDAPTLADAATLLFNYEVSLGYVNSKAHGAKLDEELGLLSDNLDYEGSGSVDRVVLTGHVPIPELADAIGRVQTEQLTLPRYQRLRAIVGTSVVSHGVDLDRLNVLVMTGMPTTAADYIQVTARSGRSHAGLVVTVYDAFSRRERSMFSNFSSYHRFLDQMVTPVPVNKYAFFVADRTVPGIVLALLHDLSRDPTIGAPTQGIRVSKDFQGWWNTHRQAIDTKVQERLRRCYQTPVAGVNDPGMEAELGDRAVTRWVEVESKALNRPPEEKRTTTMFHQPPLSNFRDIDDPADFTVSHLSRDAFEAVTGQRATRTDADTTPDGSGGQE